MFSEGLIPLHLEGSGGLEIGGSHGGRRAARNSEAFNERRGGGRVDFGAREHEILSQFNMEWFNMGKSRKMKVGK